MNLFLLLNPTMHNIEKIIDLNLVKKTRLELKNKKIAFTNGCFDILHRGHVTYLNQAKSKADFLWIGLNSDSSVKALKGQSRPINNELSRAFLLANLICVDFITIFNQDTPVELVKAIKPDVYVKGGDYSIEDLVEYPVVKSYGGEVVIEPFIDGFSTTDILKRGA